MAKKALTQLKLQIPAGKANPAPPIGSALGQHGVNIQQFCQQFNDATKEMGDDIIPTIISVYEDRSFDFVLKTPPASALLKKAAGIDKGAGDILKGSGSVTAIQVDEIAERKMQDLNARTKEAASRIVCGTARSMGIGVNK